MKLHHTPLLMLPLLAAVHLSPAQAADEKRLHFLVTEARFDEALPGIHLGLENKAATKTVAERKLTVTGSEPQFTVRGLVACRPGAKLTKVRAVAGGIVNNNGTIYIMSDWGASPEITQYSGLQSAQVQIPLTVKVSRTYAGQAVDLSFNPAYAFEKKLAAFVSNGGSAVQYLHTDEAFSMDVPINLIAWCKMEDSNSALYGTEAGGFVRREVQATILFSGDPAIVDGVGVVSSTRATGGTIQAPQPAPESSDKPVRATRPAEPRPPRAAR